MSTYEEIAHDAASNILKLADKIMSGKEPDKNEESMKRITSLRHEIDLCMEEAKFTCNREYYGDNDCGTKALEKIDKVIGFVKDSLSDHDHMKKMRETFGDDIIDSFIRAARDDMYDICSPTSTDTDRINWYAPSGYYREPSIIHSEQDSLLMNTMMEPISRAVTAAQKVSDKTVNVMFSRANYEPHTIEMLKEELGDNIRIYGTYDESDLMQGRETRLCMERCAIGLPNSYQISNNVFDIIYSRSITSQRYGNYNGVPSAAESKITKDMKRLWRYLAPGGILLLLVPKFCMRQKERMTASSYYSLVWNEKIECEKYPDLDLRLLALRKETTISDEEKDATYQALVEMNVTEEPEDAYASIPTRDFGPVRWVRGSEDDLLIVEIALENSTLKVKKDKTKVRNIEPLLPLKKGQIGQIIASGRLNGIIDEGDGFKHVISGRVVKGNRRKYSQDYSDSEHAVEEIKIISNNLVEINALGGDGIIRTISMAVNS